MQLNRINIQMKNSAIKLGDIVRLLQPFRAERYSFQAYTFGLVAGVVTDTSTRSKIPEVIGESLPAAQTHQPESEQLVVYLYEPDSSTTYMDHFGDRALFSFDPDEVELYKAISTPQLISKGEWH
jgi:hypothetical protein